MDAVPACFRANIDDQVAFAGGLTQKYFIRIRNPETKNVDENVAVVAGVKPISPPTVGTPMQFPYLEIPLTTPFKR